MSDGTTPIDYYDLDANELSVRGEPLLRLTSRLGYAQLVALAISGKVVSLDALGTLIAQAMKAVQYSFPDLSEARDLKGSGTGSVAWVARSILGLTETAGARRMPNPCPELFSDDEWYGYVLFHAVASLIEIQHETSGIGAFASSSLECSDPSEYARDLMRAFLPTRAAPISLKTLVPDKLMGSLIGGFGVVAPTTALARFSASTRAPMEWGIVASAMGCGSSHLGACSVAMLRLEEAGLQSQSCDRIAATYCATKPFPGFGHPIMTSDPRVDYLFDEFSLFPLAAKARTVANSVTERYGLHPNIDFVAGALFLSYEIPPPCGSLLFWFCRLPIIIAHICAKRREPPFGLRSSEAREKYRDIPKSWL